jgi:hypothetical protein
MAVCGLQEGRQPFAALFANSSSFFYLSTSFNAVSALLFA